MIVVRFEGVANARTSTLLQRTMHKQISIPPSPVPSQLAFQVAVNQKHKMKINKHIQQFHPNNIAPGTTFSSSILVLKRTGQKVIELHNQFSCVQTCRATAILKCRTSSHLINTTNEGIVILSKLDPAEKNLYEEEL